MTILDKIKNKEDSFEYIGATWAYDEFTGLYNIISDKDSLYCEGWLDNMNNFGLAVGIIRPVPYRGSGSYEIVGPLGTIDQIYAVQECVRIPYTYSIAEYKTDVLYIKSFDKYNLDDNITDILKPVEEYISGNTYNANDLAMWLAVGDEFNIRTSRDKLIDNIAENLLHGNCVCDSYIALFVSYVYEWFTDMIDDESFVTPMECIGTPYQNYIYSLVDTETFHKILYRYLFNKITNLLKDGLITGILLDTVKLITSSDAPGIFEKICKNSESSTERITRCVAIQLILDNCDDYVKIGRDV